MLRWDAYANSSSRAGDSPGNHFQFGEYQLVRVDQDRILNRDIEISIVYSIDLVVVMHRQKGGARILLYPSQGSSRCAREQRGVRSNIL